MTDGEVPEPPHPFDIDPLLAAWPGGAMLWRVHRLTRRPAEFNPGVDRGRFHPFSGPAGGAVPTLYASDTWKGAVCESLFRDLPRHGPLRRKRRAELAGRGMSLVKLRRRVSLVEMRGDGLLRIGLKRRDLLECDADQYERTARWAAALHQKVPGAAGLVWISRFHDTSSSLVFFGDRASERDFAVVDGPLPLADGPGLARVMELAEEARILITL